MGGRQSVFQRCDDPDCPICYGQQRDESPTPPPEHRYYIPESPDFSATYEIGPEGGTFDRMSEDGSRLDIPRGALPGFVKVTTRANVNNPSPDTEPIPDGCEVGSSYHRMETESGPVRLRKRVRFEFEHCMEDEDAVEVVMATRGHQYERMDRDDYRVGRSSVFVSMKELMSQSLAVVYTVTRRRFVDYCGMLYRLQREANMTTVLNFQLVVVKDLMTCINAVQHNCHRKERATSKVKVDQALEPFPLSFDDAEKLVMDLPMEGIYTTGWNVTPLVFPAEITKDDAYYYLPTNSRMPMCQVDASSNGQHPPRLSHLVPLKGIKKPSALCLSFPDVHASEPPSNGNPKPLRSWRSTPDLSAEAKHPDGIPGQSPSSNGCRAPGRSSSHRGQSVPPSDEDSPWTGRPPSPKRPRFMYRNPAWKRDASNGDSDLPSSPPLRACRSTEYLNDVSSPGGPSSPGTQAMDNGYTPIQQWQSAPHLNIPTEDLSRLGESPTMAELMRFRGVGLRFNIPEQIGVDYLKFGLCILEEGARAKISNFAYQYRYNPLEINRETLHCWLEGVGRKPVTWATLIQVLREVELNEIADEIEDTQKGQFPLQ